MAQRRDADSAGRVSPAFDAALFYVSITALAVGVMTALRASVERRSRNGAAVILAACGIAGLAVAVAAFLTGPKTVLPF